MNQFQLTKVFFLDNKLGTEAYAQAAPLPHAMLNVVLAPDKR